MGVCAPVLFLVFNRPEQTDRVFQAIRAAQPARLYVAADGPRNNRDGEAERCEQVRKIATTVDWPCELFTLFRASNLGCAHAVCQAIQWFFSCEAEGIILEDDCLPDLSFFPYCTQLLERYRIDTRVGQICGFNLLPEYSPLASDYFPSHFGWSWGWASWRRAWEAFDFSMALWGDMKALGLHRQYPFYPERVRLFDGVLSGEIADSCWDYQWHCALASQGQLSMVPSVNLVQNIGFTQDATHTQTSDARRSRVASSIEGGEIIRHPSFMLANPAYEARLIQVAHAGATRQRLNAVVRSVLNQLRRVGR